MRHTLRFVVAAFCLLAFRLFLSAQTIAPLKLLPAPKEVRPGKGAYHVTSVTPIFVNARHFAEDRTAAEMLSQEILEQAGLQIPVETVTDLPKDGIVLARLTDSAVRVLLPQDLSEKDLGDQGYLIGASPSHILVAAFSGQGLFYGVQTLRQLLRRQNSELICPAVAIRDWPSMSWRGVHDDISRGPVPTLDYMKKQVRTLAAYKINLFALYMEHIFDFQSQPLIAPKEAALTPAQIRELVEYAQKYYVTILPEQQTFGHLHHALKYEIYSDIAETPHGHVLTPTNEKSYDFIRTLYAELIPLFPGPFLHVGGDETFELGRGQTKALADQIGLGRVYLEHLQKVSAILHPYHKQLMFWGDIAVKYPQLLHILPKDMIAVPWDYDAKPSYEAVLRPYTDAGLEIVVAPGVSNWNAVWPDFAVAYENIRNFVRDGQKAKAMGMLNTTWDDDGETLFDMTWPGLVFGAAAAWQPGESSIDDFQASYDWAFYRNPGDAFGETIEDMNRAHATLKATGREEGAVDDLFWADPFTLVGATQLQQVLPAARDLRLGAEHALERLYRHRTDAHANADTLDDMIFAAWRLDTLGMKIQFTWEMNRFYWDAYQNLADSDRVSRDLEEITSINARLEDLRDATTRLRGMYAEAWQRENRPYWLGNVLVRYDTLAGKFQAQIVAVRDAVHDYETRKTLPPPQQLGFYLEPKP
ncbi:MAG TPA: beta-N-acetylhexosaminidase [Terriglobales bacterium]|nr:beta-N-acetylhexosaminidase [Terriglobales bacterium]